MTFAPPRSRVFLCSLASKRWNCGRFVSTKLSRPGDLDLQQDEIWQAGPLHAQGTAELLANTEGEVRIQGRFEVQMEAECDRCLGRARFPLDTSFDLFYRPASSIAREEEVEIDEGEAQLGFYQGGGMELEDILREQILLVMPMQRICREDCKGICPRAAATAMKRPATARKTPPVTGGALYKV